MVSRGIVIRTVRQVTSPSKARGLQLESVRIEKFRREINDDHLGNERARD